MYVYIYIHIYIYMIAVERVGGDETSLGSDVTWWFQLVLWHALVSAVACFSSVRRLYAK